MAAKDMFPCGVCQQHVSWSSKAVKCENCEVWIHKTCTSLISAECSNTEGTSWQCYCCRSVNVNSFVYRAYNLNTSNSFEPLAGIPGDDSIFLSSVSSPSDRFVPKYFSSPKVSRNNTHHSSSSTAGSLNETPSGTSKDNTTSSTAARNNLRIGTMNANSIKGKRAEIAELIDSTNIDILIISETNLFQNRNRKPCQML